MTVQNSMKNYIQTLSLVIISGVADRTVRSPLLRLEAAHLKRLPRLARVALTASVFPPTGGAEPPSSGCGKLDRFNQESGKTG
jgi:hypothetical protein